MKYASYLLFISFLLLKLPAAVCQQTYYLKNSGEYVKKKEQADFIRVVQKRVKNQVLYPISDFYLSGNKKSVGWSYMKVPPVYEGQYVSFFETGATKQVMKYAGGKIVDTVQSYFPNGNLYKSLLYTQVGDSTNIYVITVNDSTGKSLVANGNGQAIFYDDAFKYISEQGRISNGKYEGEWNGVFKTSGSLRFKEFYVGGKMLKGESVDEQGNVFHYTNPEVPPSYEGGINNFYRHVASGIRYPPAAAAQRIQGKVHVKFLVLADGKIGGVHVINDVHPALADEAMRILKSSKNWIPGRQKGRIVEMTYIIPISFSLGY